ncbi:hypothetical protein KFE25_003546 [Diacronema lutheri]|uniref:Uncharacterized protein n=1 Tax=Diacronema lutheri TaxID=2081491 RepID=A0A8J6CEE3_DIALT|nr:hypothetical protein KFE25_003546 [Diacronema lutheri]
MRTVGALFALLGLASCKPPSWLPDVPPSAEQVELGYWSYALSAALLFEGDAQATAQFCRALLFNGAATLPLSDERREAYRDALRSPVVQAKLSEILFRDDCAMLLWYFRTATLVPFEPGEAVALAQLPEVLFRVPAEEELGGEPADGKASSAARDALALFDSAAVRAAVVNQLEAGFLGARRALAPGVAGPLVSERPVVELAVMSGCPYGIAAETAFAPLVAHFGDSIELSVRFIIFDLPMDKVPERYCAAAAPPATFNASGGDVFAVLGFEAGTSPNACSMHGAAEANEDLRQLAIQEVSGMGAWWQYVRALNELECPPAELDECAPRAAANASLDYAAIVAHAAQAHAALVSRSLEWLRARTGPPLGSPTLLVNNATAATGALDTLGYARRICRFFADGAAPDVCAARSLEALEESMPPAPRAVPGAPAPTCLQPELGAARVAPRGAHARAGGLLATTGLFGGLGATRAPRAHGGAPLGAAALAGALAGAAFVAALVGARRTGSAGARGRLARLPLA